MTDNFSFYNIIEWIMIIIIPLIFFGVPIASLVWFFISLSKLRSTEKSSEEYPHRKKRFITSAITAACLNSAAIALIIWFAYGIAHM